MQKIDELTADQIEWNDVIGYNGDTIRVTTEPNDEMDYIYFWGWNFSSGDAEEFILFPDEIVDYYGVGNGD
jgi:hypothetical protein